MNAAANAAIQQELDTPTMCAARYGMAVNNVDYYAPYGISPKSGAVGALGSSGFNAGNEFEITTSDSTWEGVAAGAAALGQRRITTTSDLLKRAQEAHASIKQAVQGKQTKAASMNDQTSSFRIVRVIIADPNTNVPLSNRILYDSGEITTDLDDRELFFEVNIKDKLDKHNELRATLLDKGYSKAKDKDMFLEPLRIRDLRMTVITVASF